MNDLAHWLSVPENACAAIGLLLVLALFCYGFAAEFGGDR